MKRLVDHSLRLGLDEDIYQLIEKILRDRKSIIPSTSRNDILVELIQNGILVEQGKVKLLDEEEEE